MEILMFVSNSLVHLAILFTSIEKTKLSTSSVFNKVQAKNYV